MAALRDVLDAVCRARCLPSTRLDQQILLRGVYFTSGTQEGTPIDRLLGAIGRRFGVAPEAVVPSTGRGKAYFVERLLKEVLIGESGLAGVNRRLEMQKAALQLGAYAAMVLAGGRRRARVLHELQPQSHLHVRDGEPSWRRWSRCRRLPRTLRSKPSCRASTRCARSSIRRTATATTRRGRCAGDSTRDARSAMRHATPTCGSSTARCCRASPPASRSGSSSSRPQPEKLYEYLKAYLMLGEPKHLDKKHLQFVVRPRVARGRQCRPRRRGGPLEALPEPAGVQRRPAPDRAEPVARSRRRAAPCARRRFRGSSTAA